MKKFLILVVMLVVGLAAPALAQDSQDGPKPVVQVDTAPTHLGSEGPSLTLGSDVESRNLLLVGFSAGAAYDSKGLYNGSTGGYSGDTRYFFQPTVAFQRTYTTGAWTLSYTPGISYSQNDTQSSQYTQNLSGDWVWKPNGRLMLHVREDFSLTDNPFESIGRVDLLPPLGGPTGPGYNGVLADTKRTGTVTNVDLSYKVGEHSAVGVTAGYQLFNYDATTSATTTFPYVDSHLVTGSAFFSHQINREVTLGVQMSYMDIYSTGAEIARTQAPAPMVFAKITPGSRTVITLYGGPEYTRTREVIALGGLSLISYTHHWYPTYGATVSWSGNRQGWDAQVQQRIVSGSGVLEAVKDIEAGAGYRLRLSQRWTGELRANFTDQDGIGVLSTGTNFRSFWAGGGPIYKVTSRWALRGQVAYVHQTQTGLGPVAGNHLLVQGSLEYRLRKNLGE